VFLHRKQQRIGPRALWARTPVQVRSGNPSGFSGCADDLAVATRCPGFTSMRLVWRFLMMRKHFLVSITAPGASASMGAPSSGAVSPLRRGFYRRKV
jgi:hypothetical protein